MPYYRIVRNFPCATAPGPGHVSIRCCLAGLIASLALAAGAAFAQMPVSGMQEAVQAPFDAQAEPLPLLWFDEQGRPKAQAVQAIDLLQQAGGQGLNPDRYDVHGLREAFDRARAGPGLDALAAAELETALTAAMQLYLSDLHIGRVDPRRVHAKFRPPSAPGLDIAALLRTAVEENRLPQAIAQAVPQIPLYDELLQALERYRLLAGHPAWLTPLPALPGNKLDVGQTYAGLDVLAERLAALGDLPIGMPAPLRYEGPLVDAVRHFQSRHGLTVDGVIGRATLAALEVSPAQRLEQIELSLERLRWTPLQQAERMVLVNIPEFALRAYEMREGRMDLQLSMRVIVGRAMDTSTPVFDEDMRFIEFSPYWNIPISIARAETIPKLRGNPAYLDQQGLEFVTRDGQVLRSVTEANLQAVRSGQMRIRQRPGPRNALGDIKFILPNNSNIYLHHTPATQLFARERRDFSHGCIRVEEPVALAGFVLRDEPQWTEERIRAAMDGGRSRTIRLAQPLPVVIAYSTAVVKNGSVYFFPDIYGHDKLLNTALHESTRARAVVRVRDFAAN